MLALRTLVSLLASLAVASTIVAAATMWRLLHDPVSLTTTTLGSLLLPLARAVGHALGVIVRQF
jgi:hypothetical protein